MSWNEATIIGNLARDPEVRTTQKGSKIATLSAATSESWIDKATGERKGRTEWHRVVVFGRMAEVAEKYCRKGTMVAVRGSIRTRKWRDQLGNDKFSTEIIVDGSESKLKILKDGIDARNGSASQERQATSGASKGVHPENHGAFDDDIRF